MSEEPIPVVDGHNDTAGLAAREDREGGAFLESDEGARKDGGGSRSDEPAGHLDLARAREAGMAAGFFAAFAPSEEWDPDDGFDAHPPSVDQARAETLTLATLDRLAAWADRTEGFDLVASTDDLRACIDGVARGEDPTPVGAVPHVEGAGCIAPDLSNLDAFLDRGLKSLGLVWSRPNAFAEGVPFTHDTSPDTGPGLTEAGERLVRACEDRGVLVDLAHLNEAGFWDVADLTGQPLVVSHAGAHEVSPAARNLTDDQLDAVADSGGLVGLTFAVPHLRPDGDREADASLATLLDHLDHLVDRMGVEHVALGSDFDGATVPEAVGDVRGLRTVLDGLADRGYSRAEREAIAHGNWLRACAAWWT